MEEPVPLTPSHRALATAALWALLLTLAGCAALPAERAMPAPPAVAPVVAAAPEPPPAPAPEPPPAPVVTPALPQAAAAERFATGLASERADLWQRVREGFALPPHDNALVRKWEQYYAARPDYVARITERGGRYLFHIVEEVSRRGLPTELALLPFIESAFNPEAMSRAKAAGMWQFMPATGKDFELRQNLFRDDRRDVLASTRAALDYLQRLHGMFNDWPLALAAYNWGQGNVLRAIASNQRARRDTGYDALRMPDETRNYLPKLQAVKNIVANPAAFGLSLPPLENHPYFLSVAIERDIDVELAARLAGLSRDAFEQLNPQHNKPVILAAGTPQILLPYDNANRFVRELARHQGPLASWTAWIAPRTLSVADAARQAGMDETELRQLNRIPPRMLVKAGSALVVRRGDAQQADVAEHLADHAAMLLAPEGRALRRVVIKAGPKGDSVAAVAARHKLSAAQVARWNGLSAQARFKPGQAIVLMQAAAPARRAAAPAAKPARSAAAKAPAHKPAAKPAARAVAE